MCGNHINIRTDLIKKELQDDIEKGFNYRSLKPSNKFIDKLFNHYYCRELCENFYDSEPDIDDYIRDMAYIYNFSKEDINDKEKYIKEKYNKEYTLEEAKRCSEESKRIYDEYDNSERKLTFCNWQEPYFKGNFGMSQKYVGDLARVILKKEIRNLGYSNRLFYAIKDEQLRIYYYGRDLIDRDYWFIFMRKVEMKIRDL